MKTRTLGPKSSSKKPSFMVDAHIFWANRLLLTAKPLRKTESLVSQNSSSKPSSTVDAEIFNVDKLLLAQKPLTKTRTLGHKKSSKKRSSTADVDIFCLNKLLLTDKPLMKTESLLYQKSSSKPTSTVYPSFRYTATHPITHQPIRTVRSTCRSSQSQPQDQFNRDPTVHSLQLHRCTVCAFTP